MNIQDLSQSLVQQVIKAGANKAEVIVGKSTEASVTTRFEKLESIDNSESTGFTIRAFVGKQQANISSTDISPDNQGKLVERVISMAKSVPADEYADLASNDMLANKLPELDIYDSYEPTIDELLERSKACEAAALTNKQITNSEGADAGYSKSEFILTTSEGFCNGYKSSSAGVSVSVLAGQGQDMQRDGDYDSKRYYSDLKSPEAIGKKAAERAIAKLNPTKLDSGQMPLIFDNEISGSIIGNLSGAIKGSAIAKGTSFLVDAMGKQLFNSGINIYDDPHIKRGQASKPFDAEGVANKKQHIIKDGILQSWLLDIRSANKLGLITTGNAARGGGLPTPSTTNFYMENGKQSRNQLIADCNNGILITEAFGMGINLITGDYSQGAGGFLIEGGKTTKPVSEITIAGKLQDMFKNLIPANDLEFKYSINAPTLLIDGMTVGGN